ncbi:MAG TPA: hypothetical protein VHE36_07695 [Sphingomicrobium sp.]|jgi:hypothetical protein|nr:hypothetical protein [Sphingomicrobium sp.]
MDSGQLTAVLIVAIVMIASIFRARVRGPLRRHDNFVGNNDQASLENRRLREEVSELKERIKVLERITVEKENSLAKEIESLRDR